MEKEMTNQDWTRVAEIEIVYKTNIKASDRPRVQSSREIYELLLSKWDMNLIEIQEQFKVLFLNRANRVLGLYQTSSGGLTGTVADPRLILAAALKAGACNIVLTHNHPSCSLLPSRSDEQLTAKIKEAARYHDIGVMDHIIVTAESYYSFADEGLL